VQAWPSPCGDLLYAMGWAPSPYDGITVPEWKCHQPLESEGAANMQTATVGLDLAKNVFQGKRPSNPSCRRGGGQANVVGCQ